jgi:hypothetical protein
MGELRTFQGRAALGRMFDGSEPAQIEVEASTGAKEQGIEMAKTINMRHKKDNKVMGFVQLIRPAVAIRRLLQADTYASCRSGETCVWREAVRTWYMPTSKGFST